MTIGSLANKFVGKRNQKSPTPKVKSVGRTKVKRVKSIASPSQRDQINPAIVKSPSRKKNKNLIGDLQEYVAVIPSARWETKRWSPKKFGMLISKLSVPCIVTGSRADEQIVKEVMRFSNGKGTNFCGKTDLKELTALIAGAKAVVSNDSGPMHIAAALGVPVIALFGPTDPYKTGPYGWQEKKNLRVIRASISCSPCFKKKCKDLLCMDGISVGTVLKELEEYI